MKAKARNPKHQGISNTQIPKRKFTRPVWSLMLGAWCFFGTWGLVFGASEEGYGPPTSSPPRPTIARAPLPPRNWIDQTQADADRKSVGCLQCHQGVEPMHKAEQNVVLGCTDCHGGNAARGLTKEQAHILPRNKEFWKTSANPPNSNVWLNHESPEFIRFMNHGDLLWGADLYNNGGFYLKNYRFGQGYGADGAPLRLINYTPVTPNDTM